MYIAVAVTTKIRENRMYSTMQNLATFIISAEIKHIDE